MSVRDKIKLFEKSNVLHTAAESLKRRGSHSISSSVQSISPNASPVNSRIAHTPPAAGNSRRQSQNHDSPASMPDSQMTSPPRDNSPRVDHASVHPGSIPEEDHGEYYYEIDAEFCAAISQYETTLDHSLILNKPFFPKPCLYTE